MRIRFNIQYFTHWGQKLAICGSLPQLGDWSDDRAVVMFPKDAGQGKWDLELEVPDDVTHVEYKYLILNEKGDASWEWGENRVVNNSVKNLDVVDVYDEWRSDSDHGNTLFSSAFTKALFNPKPYKATGKRATSVAKDKCVARLQIPVVRLEPHHRVAVSGSIDALGNWDSEKLVMLENSQFPVWSAEFTVEKKEIPFEYKFCIYDTQAEKVVFWENHANRHFYTTEVADDEKALVVRTDDQFNYPAYPWKGAGVAIPVFSLRTDDGFGSGEFLDIKKLVDWAKHTGFKLVQILPVNDTVATHSWVDSYPYAGISVFALHPIYLNLKAIGSLSSKVTQQIIEEQGKALNSLSKIDYEAVMRIKTRFFKLIYDEQKGAFHADADFKIFFNNNKEWLTSYAAFSHLRDLYGTPEFAKWGEFATFDKEKIAKLVAPETPHYHDIAIHYFIQYHLHKQLLEAAEYAREKGIVLKGDIPIGIYRNSVDAWEAPQLYNMESQAGAPPDDFAETGQNWKFPTYNWHEMAKDGYAWWIRRMQKMSDYFDSFRIDHILGFFRIWEISRNYTDGIMGYFNPSITIHKHELFGRGIPFDYFRFCRPYIREHMLGGIFGEHTSQVKEEYLVEYAPGQYHFKPEFDNQRKIEEYLKLGVDATQKQRAHNEFLKKGLFYLHTEVIFLDAPFSHGDNFNPRHSLSKTWSYTDLDNETKRKLDELYIDYFYKRNESFWREQAMIKLPVIKNATNMLICGEDLGMVPDCVPHVMSELGILSLEVQRMPKNPKIKFGHPSDYPYMSVATPSSHDTSTIRGWWEEDSARTQEFYNKILGKWGNAPFYCEPWAVKDVVNQHLYSPSMWAIFPIQDIVGMDGDLRLDDARAERINEPANPQHYWRYRFHLSMEELMEKDEFNEMVRNMISESGRYSAY